MTPEDCQDECVLFVGNSPKLLRNLPRGGDWIRVSFQRLCVETQNQTLFPLVEIKREFQPVHRIAVAVDSSNGIELRKPREPTFDGQVIIPPQSDRKSTRLNSSHVSESR